MAVGDRVRVSSSKVGVLRYLGLTEFAKGQWAGVELDAPTGKNDGSVAGRRCGLLLRYSFLKCFPVL